MIPSPTMDNQNVLMDELAAIERVYGKRVDLYKDVLQVSSQASPPEVQNAFFHQRQELFKVLSRSQADNYAEKQMDALVLSYRIIGDAVMRGEYDALRKSNHLKGIIKHDVPRTVTPEKEERQSRNSAKSGSSSRRYALDDGVLEDIALTPSRSVKRKARAYSASSYDSYGNHSDAEETYETYGTYGDTTLFSADTTLFSADTRGTETVFSAETAISKRNKSTSFLRRAADEIEGCIEDTVSAFDQVLNVFTLDDRDIRAVTGRDEFKGPRRN